MKLLETFCEMVLNHQRQWLDILLKWRYVHTNIFQNLIGKVFWLIMLCISILLSILVHSFCWLVFCCIFFTKLSVGIESCRLFYLWGFSFPTFPANFVIFRPWTCNSLVTSQMMALFTVLCGWKFFLDSEKIVMHMPCSSKPVCFLCSLVSLPCQYEQLCCWAHLWYCISFNSLCRWTT